MKSVLPVIFIALLALSGPANAQQADPQAPETEEDALIEAAYSMTIVGLSLNESCKDVLDPKHYHGFKTLFEIEIENMGGTDETIAIAHEGAVTLSDYTCEDKTACWRSAMKLPATATTEEGQKKCFDSIRSLLGDVHDLLGPEA